MPKVRLPDGRVVNFPNTMSMEEINAEIEKIVSPQAAPDPGEPERPTTRGFLRNAAVDAVNVVPNTIKGVMNLVPRMFTDPKGVGKDFLDGVQSRYGGVDNILGSAYHEPISTALDATGLVTGVRSAMRGGGVLKDIVNDRGPSTRHPLVQNPEHPNSGGRLVRPESTESVMSGMLDDVRRSTNDINGVPPGGSTWLPPPPSQTPLGTPSISAGAYDDLQRMSANRSPTPQPVPTSPNAGGRLVPGSRNRGLEDILVEGLNEAAMPERPRMVTGPPPVDMTPTGRPSISGDNYDAITGFKTRPMNEILAGNSRLNNALGLPDDVPNASSVPDAPEPPYTQRLRDTVTPDEEWHSGAEPGTPEAQSASALHRNDADMNSRFSFLTDPNSPGFINIAALPGKVISDMILKALRGGLKKASEGPNIPPVIFDPPYTPVSTMGRRAANAAYTARPEE